MKPISRSRVCSMHRRVYQHLPPSRTVEEIRKFSLASVSCLASQTGSDFRLRRPLSKKRTQLSTPPTAQNARFRYDHPTKTHQPLLYIHLSFKSNLATRRDQEEYASLQPGPSGSTTTIRYLTRYTQFLQAFADQFSLSAPQKPIRRVANITNVCFHNFFCLGDTSHSLTRRCCKHRPSSIPR